MMRISLNKNFEKFNCNDLTRFKFEETIIDLHNLFSVSDIYTTDNLLIIRLKSNGYYEKLFEGKRKEGEILYLTFSNYYLDTSYCTKFNKELYSNISSILFSQPAEVCKQTYCLDLLFNNNGFFKIACDDMSIKIKGDDTE